MEHNIELARELEVKAAIEEDKAQEQAELYEAVKEGHILSDELTAEGLTEDAKEVERITHIVEEVEHGNIKGEALEQVGLRL